MSALPRVSLIVVNWNGRAYLEGCLTSLLALDYPAFSVTVVDNASTDGSPDFVRESFPQVELIRSSHNLGYGGGANLALRTCPADVAVVLNTDIIVPPDWLAHLIAPMMADPAIGIAGCKMYYPGGRTIQHAGGFITAPQAWPGHYGLNDEDQGQHDAIRDVDYVIGAALAVKRTRSGADRAIRRRLFSVLRGRGSVSACQARRLSRGLHPRRVADASRIGDHG